MLTGFEIDTLFKWPKGRAERLARRKKIPHILLPDGAIRFELPEVQKTLRRVEGEAAK